MGTAARLRPKLLPEKLREIRIFLNVSQQEMARMLVSEIASQDRKYSLQAARVSEYERGTREPALIVVLAYSLIGKVEMFSVADDNVNVENFRRQLGTFQHFQYLRSRTKTKKSRKKRSLLGYR